MDNDNLIPLRVMGLSYNQLQNGAYALLLAQEDGPYRIPVVIGAPEAQSQPIALVGLIPPALPAPAPLRPTAGGGGVPANNAAEQNPDAQSILLNTSEHKPAAPTKGINIIVRNGRATKVFNR